MYPRDYTTILGKAFLDILCFWLFRGPDMCREGYFWSKLTKIDLIGLKIGNMMHLCGFYQFPKFCQNLSISGQFLAKKRHFFRFSDVSVEKKTSAEKPKAFRKMVQLA